jgi:hypothetical protein
VERKRSEVNGAFGYDLGWRVGGDVERAAVYDALQSPLAQGSGKKKRKIKGQRGGIFTWRANKCRDAATLGYYTP